MAVWAIEGAIRLIRSGGEFTVPDSSREAVSELRSDSQPLREFINDFLVFGPECKVARGDLFSAYIKYCAQCGTKVSSEPAFRRAFNRTISDDQVRYVDSLDIGGAICKGFMGVGLRDHAADAPNNLARLAG